MIVVFCVQFNEVLRYDQDNADHMKLPPAGSENWYYIKGQLQITVYRNL